MTMVDNSKLPATLEMTIYDFSTMPSCMNPECMEMAILSGNDN